MGKCDLWKTCSHYRPDYKCCNDDGEARHTCGIRKESMETRRIPLKERVRVKRMLRRVLQKPLREVKQE